MRNIHVRVLRVYLDPECSMKPEFRLSRQAFTSLLRILHQERDHGWGQNLEILMFTYWLAHGLSYKVTADTFDIPKTTVLRAIHKTAKAIREARSRVIHFPPPHSLEEVGQGFARLARHQAFNKAVGAIDGCHIRIKPPKNNRKCYYNYKGFHSIQLQAICDSEARFLDIFVGYPSSAYDTRILRNSPVYVQSLHPPPVFFILGDAGYPCMDHPITMIVPFKKSFDGPMQERFNKMHGRARCVVEHAFGQMKTHWGATFLKALEVQPALVSEVALACRFLHNIYLDNRDVLDEEDEEEQPEDEEEPDEPGLPPLDPGGRESSGNQIRDLTPLHTVLADHDYADI
ncbi:putative nuclease HARBI1 [Xyrichtys novacula]|uniref:Putative nuclease HARBI1 n=1 Tax=Xyrichtys novacula TaxID=13765 RepID=A0AAV1HKR4_XYRNO|nr:putative nuclease HARBI1 [Xyrichtys novacula]